MMGIKYRYGKLVQHPNQPADCYLYLCGDAIIQRIIEAGGRHCHWSSVAVTEPVGQAVLKDRAQAVETVAKVGVGHNQCAQFLNRELT